MTVNGHFSNVGEKPTEEQFGNGVQIISEDQEFKYAFQILRLSLLTVLVLTLPSTFRSKESPLPASIIT